MRKPQVQPPGSEAVHVVTWTVVANAARARVLEASPAHPAWVEVADFVHPPSRQKGVELGRDRPGHVEGIGHGLGSTSYEHRTDVREREHDRFALQVAQALDEGVAAHRCAALVLVASSPFLGRLKSHLGKQARKAVVQTVAADYTALRDDELAARLAGPGPHT